MNRKSILLLCMLLSAFAAGAQAQIKWVKTYEEGRKISRETHKPMLIDFTAEWCEVCRAMDAGFWTRTDVAELARLFVCVKVDGEKNPQVAEIYQVKSYPHLSYVDPTGAEIDSYDGYSRNGARVMIEKMFLMPKDFSALGDAAEVLTAGENDAAARNKFAEFYRAKKLYAYSAKTLEKGLAGKPNASYKEKFLADAAGDLMKIGRTADALKKYEILQREFAASQKADEYRYGSFYVYLAANKLPEAENQLAALKKDFPESKKIAQAEILLAEKSGKK